MIYLEYFGYLATILLTTMFVPQVCKTFKTKNTESLSYIFLNLEVLSSSCFIVYGFRNTYPDIPIIVSNTSVLISAILLIFLKIKYTKKIIIDEESPLIPH